MDSDTTHHFVGPTDIKLKLTRDLADETPDWARGVLRSKASSTQEPLTELVTIDAQVDATSGLQYLSVLGFHVVVVEPMSNERLHEAIALVRRLCQASPLDIGMLAFEDGFMPTATVVNQLAAMSVMVSRLRAECSLAKARAEVVRYLELQRQSCDHLAKFDDAMQAISLRQVRPVAE